MIMKIDIISSSQEVLQTIDENGHWIELPGDYGVLSTFNAESFSPPDQHYSLVSRMSPHRLRENDDGALRYQHPAQVEH